MRFLFNYAQFGYASGVRFKGLFALSFAATAPPGSIAKTVY